MSLGDFIRSERIKRGWSQRDLAKKIHRSPGAIGQWETDITKPEPMTMIDLCGIFGVEITAFFGPEGPYSGQFVDDADELAWLAVIRRIPKPDRPALLRSFGLNAHEDGPPKRTGKKNDVA